MNRKQLMFLSLSLCPPFLFSCSLIVSNLIKHTSTGRLRLTYRESVPNCFCREWRLSLKSYRRWTSVRSSRPRWWTRSWLEKNLSSSPTLGEGKRKTKNSYQTNNFNVTRMPVPLLTWLRDVSWTLRTAARPWRHPPPFERAPDQFSFAPSPMRMPLLDCCCPSTDHPVRWQLKN